MASSWVKMYHTVFPYNYKAISFSSNTLMNVGAVRITKGFVKKYKLEEKKMTHADCTNKIKRVSMLIKLPPTDLH